MEQVDLWIKNAKVFNSYLKKFVLADVSVRAGRFFYIDKARETLFLADETIDAAGQWLVPGLVDIHMHIESSMMTPEPFCRRLAELGVTTIVAEPHEIANVKGVEGVRHMIEAGRHAAVDVFCGVPSSVPSTNDALETAGAAVDFEGMKALLGERDVICVGEVMNYRQIIRENDLEITKFLSYLRDTQPRFTVEGHCPSLTDLELAKFLYAGVDSDHTEHTLEEVAQRFENGMFVEVQRKMMKPEIFQYIKDNDLYEHFGFVTDDCMADEFATAGHLDEIVRTAIAMGMTPERAIYAATFTNARRMKLTDRGAVAPGKLADFVLLNDLRQFRIHSVYKEGRRIDSGEVQFAEGPYRFPDDYYDSLHCGVLPPESFCVTVPEDVEAVSVRVMEVQAGSTRTEAREVVMPVKSHRLAWEDSGCLLALVAERHGKGGGVGYGFVTGDAIKRGAAASTWFHDHHNLFVVGADPASMYAAARRVVEMRGGLATAENGAVAAELALPVCGILSERSAEEVGAGLAGIRRSLLALGYCHANPIMSLCTLGLPVSPVLKLTDKGLVDVAAGCIVPLYTAVKNQ